MGKWMVNLCMNNSDTLLMTENSNMKKLWFSVTARSVELLNGNKGIDTEECISVISKITEKEEMEFFFDGGKNAEMVTGKLWNSLKHQTILQAWLPNVNHPEFICRVLNKIFQKENSPTHWHNTETEDVLSTQILKSGFSQMVKQTSVIYPHKIQRSKSQKDCSESQYSELADAAGGRNCAARQMMYRTSSHRL